MNHNPEVRRTWRTTPEDTKPTGDVDVATRIARHKSLLNRMHLLERMAAVESSVLAKQRTALLQKQRDSKKVQLKKQAKRVSWDVSQPSSDADDKPLQTNQKNKERSEHSQKVQAVKKDHLERQARLEGDFIVHPLDELI